MSPRQLRLFLDAQAPPPGPVASGGFLITSLSLAQAAMLRVEFGAPIAVQGGQAILVDSAGRAQPLTAGTPVSAFLHDILELAGIPHEWHPAADQPVGILSRAQIAALPGCWEAGWDPPPPHVRSLLEGDDPESGSCAICLEPFRPGDGLCRLPACGHTFHQACIARSLLHSVPRCPLCRAVVPPPGTALPLGPPPVSLGPLPGPHRAPGPAASPTPRPPPPASLPGPGVVAGALASPPGRGAGVLDPPPLGVSPVGTASSVAPAGLPGAGRVVVRAPAGPAGETPQAPRPAFAGAAPRHSAPADGLHRCAVLLPTGSPCAGVFHNRNLLCQHAPSRCAPRSRRGGSAGHELLPVPGSSLPAGVLHSRARSARARLCCSTAPQPASSPGPLPPSRLGSHRLPAPAARLLGQLALA
eukprot:12901251-Prorocentrum_lima.AAC.1